MLVCDRGGTLDSHCKLRFVYVGPQIDGFEKRRLIEFRISWVYSARKSTRTIGYSNNSRQKPHAFRKMTNETYINHRFIIHDCQTTEWTGWICQTADNGHPYAGSLGPVESSRAYWEGVSR